MIWVLSGTVNLALKSKRTVQLHWQFAKGVVVVESVTWRLDASGSKQRWPPSELTS